MEKNYCVYKLYFNNKVIYVGSSTSLDVRITAHLCSGKKFDMVDYCTLDSEAVMLHVEYALINEIEPVYNKRTTHVDVSGVFYDLSCVDWKFYKVPLLPRNKIVNSSPDVHNVAMLDISSGVYIEGDLMRAKVFIDNSNTKVSLTFNDKVVYSILSKLYKDNGVFKLQQGDMATVVGLDAVSYTHLTLPTKRIV